MNETPKQRLGKWFEDAIVEKVQRGGIGIYLPPISQQPYKP